MQLIRLWRKVHLDLKASIEFVNHSSTRPSDRRFGPLLGAHGVETYRSLNHMYKLRQGALEGKMSRLKSEVLHRIEELSWFRKYLRPLPLLPQLRWSDWLPIGEEVIIYDQQADEAVLGIVYGLGGGLHIRKVDGGRVTVDADDPAVRLKWEHEMLMSDQTCALFWIQHTSS